jgi:hypothetical protein
MGQEFFIVEHSEQEKSPNSERGIIEVSVSLSTTKSSVLVESSKKVCPEFFPPLRFFLQDAGENPLCESGEVGNHAIIIGEAEYINNRTRLWSGIANTIDGDELLFTI